MKNEEPKTRAARNRTLTLSKEENELYQRRSIILNEAAKAADIMDKTINQDILSALTHIPNGFADLIIIDPPYNLDKNYHDEIKFRKTTDENYHGYVETWLPQVIQKLKPEGTLYVCCDWKSSPVIYSVLQAHIKVLNRITWQREKGRGAKTNWKNAMEDIWFCVKNEKRYYFDVEAVKQKRKVIAPYKENGEPKDWQETEEGNFRLTYPSNFWDDISIPYWSMPENTDHPTQKPEKLIAKLILASCPVGGIVFDPFLGSGTTSVVAKKLGRHYCGVEINPLYVSWEEKRLETASYNKDIQGYCNGVFWERNSLSEQKKVKKNPKPENECLLMI